MRVCICNAGAIGGYRPGVRRPEAASEPGVQRYLIIRLTVEAMRPQRAGVAAPPAAPGTALR